MEIRKEQAGRLNLFITHLFQCEAGEFWIPLHGDHVSRPDTLLVMVGGVRHFVFIVACVTGFLDQWPGAKQWGKFVGGGLLALAYFGLVIATTAPR